ncbi:unnamed protein product [Calypogeia fissa]
MGLQFLLELPWHVTCPSLIQDFIARNPLERRRGIRARPVKWTQQLVAQVYKTPTEGEGLCDGNGELRGRIESHFLTEWRRKNGWLPEHCADVENLRPVLEFLTPILNPERQTQITLAVATTIIVSLEDKTKINWSAILKDVIQNLVGRARISKYSYIAPFLSLVLERRVFHRCRGTTVSSSFSRCGFGFISKCGGRC